MNRILKYVKKSITSILEMVGWQLVRLDTAPAPTGISLNIGSGGRKIPGFTNLDYASDWYKTRQQQAFIDYDMRNDAIPFEDASVDRIICSHVIEHIEELHVENFIKECSRVLKPGGCLRIATPDALFLSEVSSFENRYWAWAPWDLHREGETDPSPSEYLQFIVGTENLGKVNCHPKYGNDNEEILDLMSNGLSFDANFAGRHISWWSGPKLKSICDPHFTFVIESKYKGSVDPCLQTSTVDSTHPQMSLYIDCVK